LCDVENSLEALAFVREKIDSLTIYSNNDIIHDFFVNLAKEKEVKNGRIMWPVCIALTNKSPSPGSAVKMIHIFGKQESLRRIDLAIQNLKEVLI